MANPATTPPEPSAVDIAGDTVASNYSSAAFLELMNDIEPYVDDLTWQPTIHCFAGLPIELRYEIYKLYFNGNHERALATKYWPIYCFSSEELRRRGSAQFLPNLCLASKYLLKETGVFLLSSLDFQFQDLQKMMQFLDKAAQFQSLELSVAHSIRSLQQFNTNDCFGVYLCFLGSRLLASIPQKTVERSNGFTNIALNMFQHLRRLSLEFCAPFDMRYDRLAPTKPPTCTALSIKKFLEGFNPATIVRLRSLRELHVAGLSGARNARRSRTNGDNAAWTKDDECALQPLLEVAQKIKDGFKTRDQDVEVVVWMFWGKDSERKERLE
ncbi:hypothetical protein N0V87_008712 [Didymella glomerata]|uniref:Uncharacterized protein n=1 Tax=Didymella glomerata TaxID=749621 RepID=A0A9W9BWD6_9PLEO|nr:hypothetical protein N0V87_008712 [Didymella glomerata]